MQRIPISGLTLYYDAEESEAVDEIVLACERSVETITSSWQLDVPKDCRVYIMTTWPRCVFLGAPIGSQLILGLTLPLWYSEFKKRWYYAGGWSQRYGNRQVVGIKAPRLIAQTPDPIGESIFIREENPELKVLSIVCHELTHAFSSHHRLPTWMHEGLAMVTTDQCLGKSTVLRGTLQLLKEENQEQKGAEKINLKTQSREEIILLYVRGYWLTHYLVETHPELVQKLLNERFSHQELEGLIASELGIGQEAFWQEINQLVVTKYNLEFT